MGRRLFVALFVLLAFAAPALAQGQCIDLNSAGVQQLRLIIHIDEKRAPEIVRLRQERPFTSVDQLTRVKGIAAARIRDILRQGVACVQ